MTRSALLSARRRSVEAQMPGVRIAVVYASLHGHTRVVAEHVAKGAESVSGATVTVLELTAAQLDERGRWNDSSVMELLAAADAIVLGSPTLMGSASGLMKLFFEKAFELWWGQAWKDKIAAGFTNSASRSGHKLSTLEQMAVFAAQMGMIWIGAGDPPGGNRSDSTPDDVNQLGSFLGLMTQSPSGSAGPSAGDRLTAERFGRRIARAAMRWALGAEAFPPRPFGETEAARRDRAGLEEWRTFDD